MNEFPIDRTSQNVPLDSAFVNFAATAEVSASTPETFGELLVKLNDPTGAEKPQQPETDDVQTVDLTDDRPINRSEQDATVLADEHPHAPNETSSEKEPSATSSEDEGGLPIVSEDDVSDDQEMPSPQSESGEPIRQPEIVSVDQNIELNTDASSTLPIDVDAESLLPTTAMDSTQVTETDITTAKTVAIATASLETDSQSSIVTPEPTVVAPAINIGLTSESTEEQPPIAKPQTTESSLPIPLKALGTVSPMVTDGDEPMESNVTVKPEAQTIPAKEVGISVATAAADEGRHDKSIEIVTTKASQETIAGVRAASENTLPAENRLQRSKAGRHKYDVAPKQTPLTATSPVETSPSITITATRPIPEILSTTEGNTNDTAAPTSEQAESDSPKPVGKENTDPKPTTVARLQRAMARQVSADSVEGKTETQIDRVRFVERVARAFQTAVRRGDEQVRLRLSPPSLGSLNLEVSIKGMELTARLEAETNSARTLLLDNLTTLRDRLAEQGVKVEQFDVDLMDRERDGLGDDPTRHDTSGRRSRDDRQASKNEPETDAEIPVMAPTNMQDGDDKLDVVI